MDSMTGTKSWQKDPFIIFTLHFPIIFFVCPFQPNIDLRWGQSGVCSVCVDSEKKKSGEGSG